MSLQAQLLTSYIPDDVAGKRLDSVLAQMFPQYSRSRIKTWIQSGNVLVNNNVLKPRDAVVGGELVEIKIVVEPEITWVAQQIPLDIVYEDESIIVINKPPGLVVHPGAGNRDGTLSNALLYFDNNLQNVPRSGIVHRLDKDTSGLLVVARSLEAQNHLVTQLQERSMKREYEALVNGVMTAGGTINQPIGRHPVNRLKMAVNVRGKPAITHYRVIKRFRTHTHIRVNLETGRTHQIRVHMAYTHNPIVGDQSYGGRLMLPPNATDEFKQLLKGFKRQALHAAKLTIVHPKSKQIMCWQAPLPDDMAALIKAVNQDFLQTLGD